MSVAAFFHNLDLVGTIRVAVLRAIAGGLVWGGFSIWTADQQGHLTLGPGGIAGLLIAMPVVLLLVFLPLTAIFGALSRAGIPFTGLIAGIFALPFVIGDPLVWIVHKIKPALVGIDGFRLFNPAFIFVSKFAPPN